MNSFIKQFVSVALPLVLLSACASTTPPPGLNLQSSQSLNVQPPSVEHVDLQLQSKAGATASGLALGAAGMAGGAALGGAGGFIMGTACGPMFIVCSPLAAAAGAGLFGAAGGAVGVGYGGKGWISGDKGQRFNAYTEAEFDQASLETALHEHLTTAAGQHWSLDPSSSNVVTIEVRSLRVEQLPNQEVRLILNAEMTTLINGEIRAFKISQKSSPQHIDTWVANEGSFLREEVMAELGVLTETVVQTLARTG